MLATSLLGCKQEPKKFYSFSGSMRLTNIHFNEVRDMVNGVGGYSDLADGQVVVGDGDGKTIGVGRLKDFKMEKAGSDYIVNVTQSFTVGPLPKLAFYELKIGSRNPLSYSFDKLENLNWKIDVSINDGG